MFANALTWVWNRFRPAEGWIPFFLLFVATSMLAGSIAAAEWVPEGSVVLFLAPLALILSAVLAHRRLHALPAWLLLLAYGLLLTTLYLGRLVPTLGALMRGNGGDVFRRQWALLLDRAGSWLLAVTEGGSSQETIVFAAGLGLGVWLLVAYAAWAVFRQRRPLAGLALLGLALGVNGTYAGYETHRWFAAAFAGLAALLIAALHFANLEYGWQQRRVDYSPEIRFELLAVAAGVAMMLLVTSFILPAINVREIARAFRELGAVQQTEQAFDRAFGGVRQPQLGSEPAFRAGGPGVLPRAFLLGGAPELYETVAMTARVQPAHPAATHWRAASYDIYTGRGWALSEEREELWEPQAAIPQPALSGQTVFTQTVRWLVDDRTILYTVGLPLSFDQPVRLHWRGREDFSRAVRVSAAAGPGARYEATSRLVTASPAELRAAAGEAIPDLILSRYTNLSEELPQRVRDLAQEVAGSHDNPYDKARALESFLRQYPYSLEVSSPPPGRDPVDYFLFDLQTGYCDYYASAMAVMARSLGLPARLATGYLAQPADENGIQTIYQINAHAWPEIYFAGYGWVEFEPTTPFPARTELSASGATMGSPPPTPEPPLSTPPIPEQPAERVSTWWAVLLMLLLAAGWVWWHRRRLAAPPTIPWVYDRLLRSARALGVATPASQTPHEMAAVLQEQLAVWEERPRLNRLLQGAQGSVARLTALFVSYQYAPPDGEDGYSRPAREARALWRQLRRPLWLLRWLRRLTGEDG